MKYLEKYGLSEEELNKIYDNLSDEEWEAISGSRSRVEGIIEYFKSLGIENIKQILLETPYIFLYSLEEVKKLFNDCSDNEIASKVNEDPNNLDILF